MIHEITNFLDLILRSYSDYVLKQCYCSILNVKIIVMLLSASACNSYEWEDCITENPSDSGQYFIIAIHYTGLRLV